MKKNKLLGKEWDKPYNPLIIEVMKNYDKDSFLFAITGDLDNLGIFVARRGRAKAENLVDHYNQVIRNTLQKWAEQNENNLSGICFIPSGEEIFILGVSNKKEILYGLFDNFKEEVIKNLKKDNPITIEMTLPNFGGVIIKEGLREEIRGLIRKDEKGEVKKAYEIYLNLMEKIRNETARELDINKFKGLVIGDYPVQLRNIIFSQMLKYKSRTKEILKSIDKKTNKNLLFNFCGDKYGLKEGDEHKINFLLDNPFDRNKHNFFIIGGGVMRNNETENIDKLLIKKTNKKNPVVLFVPVASADKKEYIEDFDKRYSSYGANVRVLKLTSKNSNKEIKNQILKADIIYFGGGDPLILKKKIEENNLLKIIKKFAKKDVIIAGISAGAAIWFKFFVNFDKENPTKLKMEKGFDLINAIGWMHFDKEKVNFFDNIKNKKNNLFMGVENSAVIFLEKNKEIHFFSENGKKIIYFGEVLNEKLNIQISKEGKYA